MAPLFKYLHWRHADRLVSRGVLRIGTLHEYRNIEKHGTVIGDAREGSKGTILTVPELQASSSADLPEFVRERIHIGGSAHFVNAKFLVTEDSPDFYIYSVTSAYDKRVMKEMGYDGCVRIDNPMRFLEVVSRTLRHKGEFQGFFECVYMERDVHPDKRHSIHPALIKDPVYANQKEQRAIWRPLSGNPRPIIITCRKAANWCTRVA